MSSIKKLAAGFEAAWEKERNLPDDASKEEIDAAVGRTRSFIDMIVDHPKTSPRQLARINLWRQEGLWPEMERLFERLGAFSPPA